MAIKGISMSEDKLDFLDLADHALLAEVLYKNVIEVSDAFLIFSKCLKPA